MSPTLRNILIGCGALSVIGVVVLVGACALIIGTSDGGGDSADSGSGGSDPNDSGGEAQYLPLGEPATAGDVVWVITNARQATELTGEFMEPKQGNFIIVDFDFTNNGSEPVTLDSASLALLDGEGRKSEPDIETFGYIDPDKDIFLDQVNPGVTQQGEVIFTVAPDASDFVLSAGDTDPFGGENAYVNLGI